MGYAVIIGSSVLFLITLRNIFEVKKYTNNNASLFKITILVTAVIAVLPLIFIIIGLFTLYHYTINIILKIQYGDKFAGMLKGADTFHMVDDPSHSIIHCLLMVKSGIKCSSEDLMQYAKEIIWKIHQHSKFKVCFLKSYGCAYMLKQDRNVDDCIKKMNIMHRQGGLLQKQDLQVLINKYSNTPLLENEGFTWEVLVGTQPVNWKEDGDEYYPLLFRIHHAVADGVTTIKLMVGLADKPNSGSFFNKSEDKEEAFAVLEKHFMGLYDGIQTLLKILATCFYSLLLLPGCLVTNLILKGKDSNILHRMSLSKKKMLAASVEKSHEYFLKIKRIKSKITGTSFSDILLAACSASLADYLKKHTNDPPQCITMAVPVLAEALKLPYLIPGQLKLQTFNVDNNYSLLLINLPISPTKKNISVLERLELIKKETSILRNAVDYYVNYFLMSFVCPVLPLPFLKFILHKSRCSGIVSILPAPPKVTYCNGSMTVSDMVAWSPHLYHVGTTFVFNTFDNRLHIGVSVDEALISDGNDAQSIAEKIYTYLDLLENEVDSMCPKID